MNRSNSKKRKSRSMLERAQEIFEIINNEAYLFPKSRLKAANIHSHTIDNWLELIVFIQSQPRIRVRKVNTYPSESEDRTGKRFNTFVERIETNYSLLNMNRFLDESLPFNSRIQSLTDYVKSIFKQELILKSENADDLEPSQTGLLSVYDDVGSITIELQMLTLEFLKTFIPEIERIMEIYPESPKKGHVIYIDLIKQKLPILKIIARGLRDHISLGQISPRLMRDPLPYEFVARKIPLIDEESFLTGYLIGIISLVYCIIKGLNGWEFIGTSLQKKCEKLAKDKKIAMLSPLIQIVRHEIKEFEENIKSVI